VYNAALAHLKERLDTNAPLLNLVELNSWVNSNLKANPQLSFLLYAPDDILLESTMDISEVINRYKDGLNDFPKFIKKGRDDSFRFQKDFMLDEPNSRIYLPKLAWLGYHKSRDIEGKPINVTVSIETDGYYISIQTDINVAIPAAEPTQIIGADVRGLII
jgi:putative transposase